MIDYKTFNSVSQMSHWLGGCLFVIAMVFLFGPHAEWYSVGGFTVFATVKEGWYDEFFETTEVRGSSIEDWSFYMLGVAIAVGLIWLKGKFL